MCRVCVEWELGKLTNKEAFKNLGEMITSTDNEAERQHLFGLSEKILDKEMGESESSDDLDQAWHKETYGDD